MRPKDEMECQVGQRIAVRDRDAQEDGRALAERELRCLHLVSRTLARARGDLEPALQRVADLLPGGMRFPAAVVARVRLGGREYRSGPRWGGPVLAVSVAAPGDEPGVLELCYPGPLPGPPSGPFLPRERSLLRTVAERLAETLRRLGLEAELAAREELLRQRQEELEVVLGNLQGGVWAVPVGAEPGSGIPAATLPPALGRLLGYDEQSTLPAATWRSHVLTEDRPRCDRAGADLAAGRTTDHDVEYRVRCKDGDVRWVHSTGRIHRDAAGRPRRWTGMVWDVTERRRLEERLRRLAFQDPLTGLPNRALLERRIAAAVAHAATSGRPLAVAYLDVDRLRVVNETLGHRAGDAALVALCRRVETVLRPGDVLCRLGGDELVVVLPQVEAEAEAVEVAEAILQALERPLELPAGRVHTPVSIGMVVSHGGNDGEALLRLADLAMYRAKRRGGNTWELAAGDLGPSAVPVAAPAVEAPPVHASAIPLRRGILAATEIDPPAGPVPSRILEGSGARLEP